MGSGHEEKGNPPKRFPFLEWSSSAPKLEDMLLKQEITKAKFCADAGISRPTLDKLLSGNITNKANFINHMLKVLHCLAVTPDMLMGNIQNPYIKAKSLRKALRIKMNEICNITGISPERLREIESGADATMAGLRDIALCLGVGVKSILAKIFSLRRLQRWLISFNYPRRKTRSMSAGSGGILKFFLLIQKNICGIQ